MRAEDWMRKWKGDVTLYRPEAEAVADVLEAARELLADLYDPSGPLPGEEQLRERLASLDKMLEGETK